MSTSSDSALFWINLLYSIMPISHLYWGQSLRDRIPLGHPRLWHFHELKTVDTIGNCQRPVFSLGVSQHMHKITNLWKFELDWSSELRDNYERKKHPCHTKLCAFRCLISRPQILNLRSRNQIRGKLLLSRKLRHFRGSRFSQCFILSTSPHYSLPSEVLCW